MTSNTDFKVTPVFNSEYLRNGTIYIVTIIGNYVLLKGVISNDLELHSEIFDGTARAVSLRQLSFLFLPRDAYA